MKHKLLNLLILLGFFLSLCVNMAFSGEQAKIVFESREEHSANDDIWIVNGDGTGKIRLTTTGISHEPVWSPDGQKIAYYQRQYEDTTLLIENLVTGNTLYVKNGTDPQWCSDNEIFFLRKISNSSYSIYKFFLKEDFSAEVKELTGDTIYLEKVSKEDKLLFYIIYQNRIPYVGAMDFDGNDITIKYPSDEKYKYGSFCDYNEKTDCLLVYYSTNSLEYPPKTSGLCLKNLKTDKISYYENLKTGELTSDGKYIIALNNTNNLEKWDTGNNKIAALTTSGDINRIIGVTNNKIFYVRTTGDPTKYNEETADYYFWSIGIDGSSPTRLTEVPPGFMRIDVWYPKK